MKLVTENVRYGKNDVYTAYAAYPEVAKRPMPAIVVIQEAWGVDAHIEDVTRRFAEAGYVAFAPDLFSENGVRPPPLGRERIRAFLDFFNALPPGAWMDPKKRDEALAKLPEERRGPTVETMTTIFSNTTNDAYLEPILAATEFLRTAYAPSRGAKVGTIGFCMGGRLSARAACADPKLAAAVVCYGMSPPAECVEKMACPVLGLYGKTDTRIGDTVPGFVEAAKKHGKKLECVFYEGAGHAFFNDTRPSYDVAAARQAFARALSFFAANVC
jgi:carboxymethylenebutenolidase